MLQLAFKLCSFLEHVTIMHICLEPIFPGETSPWLVFLLCFDTGALPCF
jgi:hypothetical protein